MATKRFCDGCSAEMAAVSDKARDNDLKITVNSRSVFVRLQESPGCPDVCWGCVAHAILRANEPKAAAPAPALVEEAPPRPAAEPEPIAIEAPARGGAND